MWKNKLKLQGSLSMPLQTSRLRSLLLLLHLQLSLRPHLLQRQLQLLRTLLPLPHQPNLPLNQLPSPPLRPLAITVQHVANACMRPKDFLPLAGNIILPASAATIVTPLLRLASSSKRTVNPTARNAWISSSGLRAMDLEPTWLLISKIFSACYPNILFFILYFAVFRLFVEMLHYWTF